MLSPTGEDTGQRGDLGVRAGERGHVCSSLVGWKDLLHSLVQGDCQHPLLYLLPPFLLVAAEWGGEKGERGEGRERRGKGEVRERKGEGGDIGRCY